MKVHFLPRGVPAYIRTDHGSEFAAGAIRKWLGNLKVKTLYIEPGSPRESGCQESVYGKLRDDLLKRQFFTTL
jgi:putative transposase